MIPEGAQDEARPGLEPGRAYLRLLITDKDGNQRVVECDANLIKTPRLLINQPAETQGPN